MTNHLTTSRFVHNEDISQPRFIFDLPESWWSRPYEYAWASRFAEPNHVALDAACGLSHPLKYFLADHCAETYACDLDEGLNSRDAINAAACRVYQIDKLPDHYLDDIHYQVASLTELPYRDAQFDRVYCVSVLEHLTDRANKWAPLAHLPVLKDLVRRDIRDSLREFRRVLKDDGKIVLTFDFPRINLDYLKLLVPELGLRFCGAVDTTIPANALYSRQHKLYCFRALLEKA